MILGTWFQSKYGSSHSGLATIIEEGNKIITTLQGTNSTISEDTKHLLKKLEVFRKNASSNDRIVLVFATEAPIDSNDREALDRIKVIGRGQDHRQFLRLRRYL